MLTSLALVAAMSLAPAQGGGLTLSGARVTYGELGALRPDLKYLPGDVFCVSFDIDGIKVDEMGKVKYSIAMEVVNKDNTPVLTQKPIDRDDNFLPLGGAKLPARAFVTIGLDIVPGPYTCRVTVADSATKASKTLEQKFEVLPKNFGLVEVRTSADLKGEILAPPLGVPGQTLFIHFVVVGFARDAKTKQPNVDVEMAVLLKDGTPALPKPHSYTINADVGAEDTLVYLRFPLPLNRSGEYTIELKAVDKLSKASSKVLLPLKVLPTGS